MAKKRDGDGGEYIDVDCLRCGNYDLAQPVDGPGLQLCSMCMSPSPDSAATDHQR